MNSEAKDEEKEIKWGYAFAGLIAIGIAAAVQFAFGDLDEETLANMPAVLSIPYELGGKLGLTVPLAVVGLCLILRDVLVHGGGSKQTATPAPRTAASRFAKRAEPQEEEELEMGEPLSEAVEVEAEPVPSPGPAKIPGRGGFAGSPRSTRSKREEEPAPTGDGQMVLASAKYLNRKPGAGDKDFRKGKINMTQDE